MKNILLAIVLLMLNMMVYAHTIELNGIIRDFSSDHPDFEGAITGLQTGCVQNLLGNNGTPLASNSSSNCAISQLEDWYSDTHPSCFFKTHTITLDNGQTNPGGVYLIEDNNFFPIDNELDGNEGRSHNYHFTFEARFMFAYQAGQTVAFHGDDDVWIFVNNKLIIDLGGVHSAIGAQVALQDIAADLGLVEGEIYSFALFFAERHTFGSHFKLELGDIIPFAAGTNMGLMNMLEKNETTCLLLGTDCTSLNERTVNMWVNVGVPRDAGVEALLANRVHIYRHFANMPSDNNNLVQALHNNIKQTCQHMVEHPQVTDLPMSEKQKAIIFCESGAYNRINRMLWDGWFSGSTTASLFNKTPLFLKVGAPDFSNLLKIQFPSGNTADECPWEPSAC